MRVLIVDDHPKIRANIKSFLKIASIESDEAVTGQDALEKCNNYDYSVILLDLNMPLMDGRTFLRTIREKTNATPVLVLTSDTLLSDKVDLFDMGADDYLTKPFEHEELIARIKALARRKEKTLEQTLMLGDFCLYFDKMRLEENGKAIDLGAKEWGILEFLAKNKGTPKNKNDILEAVWGETEESLGFDSTTLEVHISSLRKKLGKDLIRTIRNVGYIID